MSKEYDGYVIKKLSYRVWLVVSPEGRSYYVILTDRKWICTCPYYNRFPRACKHIRYVIRSIMEESKK